MNRKRDTTMTMKARNIQVAHWEVNSGALERGKLQGSNTIYMSCISAPPSPSSIYAFSPVVSFFYAQSKCSRYTASLGTSDPITVDFRLKVPTSHEIHARSLWVSHRHSALRIID